MHTIRAKTDRQRQTDPKDVQTDGRTDRRRIDNGWMYGRTERHFFIYIERFNVKLLCFKNALYLQR